MSALSFSITHFLPCMQEDRARARLKAIVFNTFRFQTSYVNYSEQLTRVRMQQ